MLAAAVVAASGPAVRAQELEPRTLSPAPVGMNFVVASFGQARGALSVDPSLPVTSPDLKLTGPVLGYARALDLGGLSGKVDVIVPITRLSGTARFQGEPVTRRVDGMGDPLVRLSALLYGAPAMTPQAFKAYKQDLLIGVGVQVGVPLGQYDGSRLLNIGGHRWMVRPDLGVSQTFGRWVLELRTSATLFTENNDFFGGHRREESAIWAGETHLIYNWPRGAWCSLDAIYFTGGQTTVDDLAVGGTLQNGRAGGTCAVPVTPRASLKFSGSGGVSARTHNNFGLVGVAWQYRWGAGR